MLNTFSRSLIIWEPTIFKTRAPGTNWGPGELNSSAHVGNYTLTPELLDRFTFLSYKVETPQKIVGRFVFIVFLTNSRVAQTSASGSRWRPIFSGDFLNKDASTYMLKFSWRSDCFFFAAEVRAKLRENARSGDVRFFRKFLDPDSEI